MYQAFRDLGRTFAEMEGREDPRELLLDPLGPGYDRCVVLVFDDRGRYLRVDSESFSAEEASRIKYKDASGNNSPTRPLPIIKMSGKEAETVRRLLRTAAEIGPWLMERGQTEWGAWAISVGQQEEDEERIIEETVTAARALTVKRTRKTEPHNVFLTLGLSRGDKVVWMLDEVPSLIERAMEGIREKYGKNASPGDVIAEGVACQVCGSADREVFGNFNEIKCYNLNKPGMVVGGFGRTRPVRNVPICLDCAALINYGFSRSQEVLKYRAAGSTYLLLPRTSEDEIRREFVEKALGARKKERSFQKKKGQAPALAADGATLRRHTLARITDDENEILEMIADEFGGRALLTLQMIFLHAGQAAEWKMKADIDEVLPSRIQQVFNAKRKVERDPWFSERKKPVTVTMRRVREFAHQGQEFAFLAVVSAIFRGGTLDRDAVFQDVVDRILQVYKKEGEGLGSYTTAAALAYVRFLEELEIIPKPEVIPMQHDASMNPYRAYFEAHQDTFATPDRRVAFLTGALVNILLGVQYQERSATPFFNKLRGLKLTRDHLRDLMPEVQAKLEQYGKSGYAHQVRELLSHEWVDAVPTWSLTDSEATFYFVLGMNLQFHIGGSAKAEGENHNASEKEE